MRSLTRYFATVDSAKSYPSRRSSAPPMELRPVNFPVENGQLLTQCEILSSKRCSGRDQAPDEQKKS
jgi:hypothetical protein